MHTAFPRPLRGHIIRKHRSEKLSPGLDRVDETRATRRGRLRDFRQAEDDAQGPKAAGMWPFRPRSSCRRGSLRTLTPSPPPSTSARPSKRSTYGTRFGGRRRRLRRRDRWGTTSSWTSTATPCAQTFNLRDNRTPGRPHTLL